MLFFDAWSISNKGKADECTKVIFFGKNKIDKNYFFNLVFKEGFNEIYLGKVAVWRLFFYSWGLSKSYDLIIVKSRMKFCDLLRSKRNFVIPDWISCEIDLCSDIGSRSLSRKTLKNNLRKIKKSNFSYSISKDPVDFHFFYYNMHLPYISERYGSSAIIQSYQEMKKSFKNGELLQVKEGRKNVAGVIIDYKIMNDMPRTTKLGVLRGDFQLVKKGALIALYYYTIQYLKEKKYDKLSLGLTRAFINDGVLLHKLNWGAKIVCETSQAFLLSLYSPKKCLKNFLSDNPFIFKDRNKLSLAIFYYQNLKECPLLHKDEKKLRLCGLDKRTFFLF
jgi:hypothetical protein